MECNKDEAVKAKEIAEKKLSEKDIAGAQKFALKAQNLFPGLDGLSQFLEVLNIYVAYEKKINGEVDFYGVLSVDSSANDETIRKHYRRLALALHPDKNKSVGADGAFKILSEAWSLLSDRTRKMMYDNKCAMRNVGIGNSSMQGNQRGFHNSSMNPASARDSTHADFKPSQPSKHETFWTACNLCQTKYEYLKRYLNRNLMCPHCHKPFLARKVSAPVNESSSPFPRPPDQQQQGTNYHAANGYSASGVKLPTALNSEKTGYSGFGSTVRANIQQDQFVKTRVANGVKQAVHRSQPSGENLKRAHPEVSAVNQEAFLKKCNPSMTTDAGFVADTVTKLSKADRLTKKRRIVELKSNCQRKGGSSCQGNIHGTENGVLRAEGASVMGSNKPRSSRELSNLEIRNMLAKKARMEISKKLKEWSTAAASRPSYKEEKEVEKKKQTAPELAIPNDLRRDKPANDAVVDSKRSCEHKSSSAFIEAVDDLEPEVKAMAVPDSDFHNFDKDRTEKSFDDNQVWAAYDDDDGMPRYYALIHKVISKKPFKVEMSWLNSKTNSELGPINWVGSGFFKTSGDFRIGKHEINKSLNSFSHKVKWVKGARGVIQIFPGKGDVWALYRHWSPKWNELTPDDVIHKYDMVEVLGDYSEKEGVTVAPLVKVAGFRSVFRQHLDPKYIRHIPREEMFRFSHQVPSYLLMGKEAANAPNGCWELDPAALPLELLRVMTDVEIEAERKAADSSILESACGVNKEKEKSNVVGNSTVVKGDESIRDSKSVVKQPILTYSRKKKVKTVEASCIEPKEESS